eukprot:SAG22_NODE_3552_length_1648_cov_1.466753_1_plen_438_part_10
MPLIIGDDETTECFLDRLTESAKGSGGEALAPGILVQALSHEALGKSQSKLREEKRARAAAKAEKDEEKRAAKAEKDEEGQLRRARQAMAAAAAAADCASLNLESLPPLATNYLGGAASAEARLWLSSSTRAAGSFRESLPPELAAQLLLDPDFQPGNRPLIFDRGAGQWVFKESSTFKRKQSQAQMPTKDGQIADRWHSSGGLRFSRDLPRPAPRVRRRYGVIEERLLQASETQSGRVTKSITYSFHAYTLLVEGSGISGSGGPGPDEDISVRLYHVVIRRPPATARLPRQPRSSAAVPKQEAQSQVGGGSGAAIVPGFDEELTWSGGGGDGGSSPLSLLGSDCYLGSTPNPAGDGDADGLLTVVDWQSEMHDGATHGAGRSRKRARSDIGDGLAVGDWSDAKPSWYGWIPGGGRMDTLDGGSCGSQRDDDTDGCYS